MKELINSLKAIKEECKKHDDCNDCVFYKSTQYLIKPNLCGISNTRPDLWEINDQPTERLLK